MRLCCLAGMTLRQTDLDMSATKPTVDSSYIWSRHKVHKNFHLTPGDIGCKDFHTADPSKLEQVDQNLAYFPQPKKTSVLTGNRQCTLLYFT